MLPLWSDATSGVRVGRFSLGQHEVQIAEPVNALVSLFEEIAAAEGWQPGHALQRGQANSVYFALEVRGQVVGGLQLEWTDAQGTLPCLDIWPEVAPILVSSSGKTCAHVSILALAPEYRGQGLLFWRLVIEMWRYCVGQGITTLFIEVTPRVLPLYHRLGWPLKIVGELRKHWGEDCYLCTLGIPEVAEALLRRAEHSPYYRQIIAQAFRLTLPAKFPQATPVAQESPQAAL